MGIIGLRTDRTLRSRAVRRRLGAVSRLLEPGRTCFLFLTAEVQAEEVRARIQKVEPLDEAQRNAERLRVFLRNEEPIDVVARRLDATPKKAASAMAGAGRRRGQHGALSERQRGRVKSREV